MSESKNRGNIKVGQKAEIVQKRDQRSGTLTTGVINRILTNLSYHPHGIKVELETGKIGRVKNMLLT